MLVSHQTAQKIITALSKKSFSFEDLTPKFEEIRIKRSDESIIDSLFKKDDRGRTREVIATSLRRGAFGEVAIAQMLTSAGMDVSYGSDGGQIDYGFDIIADGAKIEIKKQGNFNTFVSFNHPRQFLNIQDSAAAKKFDLMVAWRIINGFVVPWALASNEVFSTTLFARSTTPTTDFYGNLVLDPLGNKVYGKFIKDGLATNADQFKWL